MRALQVIAGLAPTHGGPSYSVPRLSAALNGVGCMSEVLTVGVERSTNASEISEYPPRYERTPILSKLRLSPALRGALSARSHFAPVIHDHGLWLMPNVYAGQVAAEMKCPLVVSPRGMLAAPALAVSPIRKRLFWTLFLARSLSTAAAWQATSLREAEDIRAFGINAPIAVIPNGIDLAERGALHSDRVGPRTILFLSRVHPHKGLPTLLEAWSRLAPHCSDWRIVIAGPDEAGHRLELGRMINSHAIPRVNFVGPVYGKAKEALMQQADVFVLPTRSENFGIAVAEALAAGVPAIVTKGAPWQGLEERRCGWWIDQGVAPLVEALRAATTLPARIRREMGARGRTWMEEDFSWEAVARQTMALYAWVSIGGEQPEFLL